MIYTAKKTNILILVLVLIIAGMGLLLYRNNVKAPLIADTANQAQQTVTTTPITITEKKITEQNFTGSQSVIAGSGVLADAARAYINQTVAAFKKTADEDIPALHAQFGNDIASDQYEIDIKATYIKAQKTDSIIIDDYENTGGASGNNSYKVFTASHASGTIISLGDVVAVNKQAAFTAFVKNKLSTWIPDGSAAPAVFQDQVQALTFASFSNWSFDKNNLIIYFDKYAIGPGALGAVAFPLPVSKIQGYLSTGY